MRYKSDNELLEIALKQYAFVLPVNMNNYISGCEFAKKILEVFDGCKATEIAKVCMRRIKKVRRFQGRIEGIIK